MGTIKDGKLKIPKFKDGIRINLHRELQGKIGKMTITRTPAGRYFVSIFTEQEVGQFPTTDKLVGIDWGLEDFLITSDGKKLKNNRYTKHYAKKLKEAQQHLSRKQKGSDGLSLIHI